MLEYAFERVESRSNGLNLDSYGSNAFWLVRICIQIPLKWLEFAFECFKFGSNGSKLHSNASNPFTMVRICIPCFKSHFQMVRILWICIQMLQISFEGFKFPFEWLESHFNWLKFHSNASNLVLSVQICIWMIWTWLEWFEFAF